MKQTSEEGYRNAVGFDISDMFKRVMDMTGGREEGWEKVVEMNAFSGPLFSDIFNLLSDPQVVSEAVNLLLKDISSMPSHQTIDFSTFNLTRIPPRDISRGVSRNEEGPKIEELKED